MKQKYFYMWVYFLIILLLVINCQSEKEKNKQRLIGNWSVSRLKIINKITNKTLKEIKSDASVTYFDDNSFVDRSSFVIRGSYRLVHKNKIEIILKELEDNKKILDEETQKILSSNFNKPWIYDFEFFADKLTMKRVISDSTIEIMEYLKKID